MNCLNKGRQETAYSLPRRSVLPAIKATTTSPSKTQYPCGVLDCLHSGSVAFYPLHGTSIKGEREGGGGYRKERAKPAWALAFPRIQKRLFFVTFTRGGLMRLELPIHTLSPLNQRDHWRVTDHQKNASCQLCKFSGWTSSNTPIKQTKTTSGRTEAMVKAQTYVFVLTAMVGGAKSLRASSGNRSDVCVRKKAKYKVGAY